MQYEWKWPSFPLEASGVPVGLIITMLFPLCPLSLAVTVFEVMAAWVISDRVLEGGEDGHCNEFTTSM